MSVAVDWLITGGCGFIGRNLIRALQQGAKPPLIRVVDNLSVGQRGELERVCPVVELDPETLEPREPVPDVPHVTLVVGDIRDAGLVARAIEGCRTVVHLAANTGVGPSVADPMLDCTTNVLGTLNCLEAARHARVERFIFASSGAPIGECEPPLHEELPAHPVSPYGASKLSGEAYCSAYKRTFRLDTVCLRFSNVYGPLSGHKSSVVAKFIREALQDGEWEIYGDGGQTRDFIYVDDLVAAILLAGERPDIGGEVFQIASNAETTVAELVEQLRRVLADHGITAPTLRHSAPRLGDVKRNFADTAKANRLLGWRCQVPLALGLAKTVEWFLGQRG